jgi:glycosyltransferase involved in cell wall biosynthesis
MRIGIDISVLCNQWDGIGTYVNDILEYVKSTNDENSYFLYADRPLARQLQFDNRFVLKIDNGNNHLLWILTKLKKHLKEDKLDVFWQPNFILPYNVGKTRNYINVHDMSAYAYSKYAPFKTNIAHKLFLKVSCKRAHKIWAISNNGKEEAVKYLHINPNKVNVIYIGKKMFEKGLDVTESEVLACLDKYNLAKSEYLLFVGTLSPRKNADVIVEGYFKYRRQGGTKKLVLAGNIAHKSKNIYKLVENNEFKSDVILTSYIKEVEKRILYYNSFASLFPSRLEGFGYPLLEAFQAQIPVITSNASCMPEIAGNAAIYLNDIDDSTELAQRIFAVENLSIAQRNELIDRGIKRLEFFNSQDYRKKTYEALIESEGR